MGSIDSEFGTLVGSGLKRMLHGRWEALVAKWLRHPEADDCFSGPSGPPLAIDGTGPLGPAMFCYAHFRGQGRGSLAKALGADDPFRMLPYEIVERVLADGEPPRSDVRRASRWRETGQVYEVRLGTRDFLVAISLATEEIHVQETRADPYPSVECGRVVRRPRLVACKTKMPRRPRSTAPVQAAVTAPS